MSGIFSAAWAENYATAVRVVGGITTKAGYADYGNLSSVTDSIPTVAGETDSYLAVLGGYDFDDVPTGSTPGNTPVYACVRREGRDDDIGAKAFFYVNGHTPSPTVWYPNGVSVPSALTFRLRCWLSLPNDYMLAADATYLYLGNPLVATQRATISGGGVVGSVRVLGLALLGNGQAVAAGTSVRVSDSADVVCLSAPFSVSGSLPATVAFDAQTYTYDEVNPWKACVSAIAAVHGGDILKAQTHVLSGKLLFWASYLLLPTTTGEGQWYGMSDEAFLRASDPGVAPDLNVKNGTMTYSVGGGALTYSGSATVLFSTPETNLMAFDGGAGLAASVYADSDQWTPPPVPDFWRSFRRTAES